MSTKPQEKEKAMRDETNSTYQVQRRTILEPLDMSLIERMYPDQKNKSASHTTKQKKKERTSTLPSLCSTTSVKSLSGLNPSDLRTSAFSVPLITSHSSAFTNHKRQRQQSPASSNPSHGTLAIVYTPECSIAKTIMHVSGRKIRKKKSKQPELVL